MANPGDSLYSSEITITNDGYDLRPGMVAEVAGPVGGWVFRVGFWGAVFSSMLGVWQGVPYLFCDFVGLMREPGRRGERRELPDTRSRLYRGFGAISSR